MPYDIIDNVSGHVISRGVDASAAATALGLTEGEIINGVKAASYVDGNDKRCTGYFNVWGWDWLYRWGALRWGRDFATRAPVLGYPAIGQDHLLVAAAKTVGSPVLGNPELAAEEE